MFSKFALLQTVVLMSETVSDCYNYRVLKRGTGRSDNSFPHRNFCESKVSEHWERVLLRKKTFKTEHNNE